MKSPMRFLRAKGKRPLRRGPTLGEIRYPQRLEFTGALCQQWRIDAIAILMESIWQGYDLFQAEILIDKTQPEENVERSITQFLEPRIRKFMDADAPFYLQHGPHEEATRKSAQAQPPLYDLGFVLYSNERSIFPIEAKVLPSDGAVADYVNEINENYLTCRYAPFSKEAAMLGYLLKGKASIALDRIAEKLTCQMHDFPPLLARSHKFSEHIRLHSDCLLSSRDFRCHHLILPIMPSKPRR